MALEAEIETDRMARRAAAGKETRVTRLGSSEVAATVRTREKGLRNRVDIITTLQGWYVTLKAELYRATADVPEQTVILLDKVLIDRLFTDVHQMRRSAGGRVLPPLLPGEPDLTD